MNEPFVERLCDADGAELAIVLRSEFSADGLRFFTPDDYGQQLGYMRHPAGHVVDAHVHHEVERVISTTMEVLVVRSGRVRVDIFGEELIHVGTRVLNPGDVIMLVSGGHRFEMLEAAEMIEVKQGPFVGSADKSRFSVQVPPLEDRG